MLAVCEACGNSFRHTLTPHIMVTWRIRPQVVEVLVEDEGVFRARAAVLDVEGLGRAGVGIPLMVALTDEFAIKQGTEDFPGTVVRLVKYLR